MTQIQLMLIGKNCPLDCCFDQNGDMLFLVSVQNVAHSFMREKFFPNLAPESALELYRFSKGRLISHTQLSLSQDTQKGEGHSAFFHTAVSGETFIVWSKLVDCVGDQFAKGTYLTRVSDLSAPPVRLMDEAAVFANSKVRLGAAPTDMIDLYWYKDDREILHTAFDLKQFK